MHQLRHRVKNHKYALVTIFDLTRKSVLWRFWVRLRRSGSAIHEKTSVPTVNSPPIRRSFLLWDFDIRKGFQNRPAAGAAPAWNVKQFVIEISLFVFHERFR